MSIDQNLGFCLWSRFQCKGWKLQESANNKLRLQELEGLILRHTNHETVILPGGVKPIEDASPRRQVK